MSSNHWLETDELADKLSSDGYVVLDSFLGKDEVDELLADLNAHASEGAFTDSGIGTANQYHINKEIRGDSITWLDPARARKHTQLFLEKVSELRQYFNRTCFLSLKDYEGHFAMYTAGSFYKRHTDQLKQHNHRVLSMVCYLNTQWTPDCGGQLRIYTAGGHHDVEPIAGRTVIFRSEIEHEVLLSHCKRFSVTGWFLSQLSALTFLKS